MGRAGCLRQAQSPATTPCRTCQAKAVSARNHRTRPSFASASASHLRSGSRTKSRIEREEFLVLTDEWLKFSDKR